MDQACVLSGRCGCGSCLEEGLSIGRLADKLSEQWVAAERETAEEEGRRFEWDYDMEDVIAVLEAVMRTCHFQAVSADQMCRLAERVDFVVRLRIARGRPRGSRPEGPAEILRPV